MKSILWVGDAVVASGFAKATHEVCDRLCQDHDLTVLGINYHGDPHSYEYEIYPGAVGGDPFGVARLIELCDRKKPDIIILQNDPWNMQHYLRQLVRFPEYALIPVVAALAVDGKNFFGPWLDGVTHTIFWTNFALQEARMGGYDGPASVIPLGVDLATFSPMDKKEARLKRYGQKAVETFPDMFVVGNVNRNQPRKRWDLTIKYFAEWVRSRSVPNAYLHLHVAPTGDTGVDPKRLAQYYGVYDRLILFEPPMWTGITEAEMRSVYNCFDVQISTTQGEGFGLTTFEGMACGVPQIAPDWSGLGDLCKNAACLVTCSSDAIGPPYVNVLGGVVDQDEFVDTLHALYSHEEHRSVYRKAGLDLVHQQRFSWNNIAERYAELIESILCPPQRATEEEWQDLGRPEEARA